MKSLINDSVNNKLNEIIKMLFLGNRIMDRALSVMSVKFCMTKTSDLIHPRVAHIYPKLADIISDYQSSRDCLSVYGLTPLEETDYNDPMEIFDRMIDYQEDLESLITESIELAQSESDYTTKVTLEDFLLSLVPLMNQLLLLADKMEAYKDQWMLYDANVEDWITLPIMVGKG